MLVLTRRVGEMLQIGESVIVKVVAVDGRRVRLAVDAPPSINIRRGELSRRTETESTPHNGTSSGPRSSTVLFVDNEASIRQCCQEEFERDGFRVLVSSGGEEALELLRSEPADIVVVDEHMPGWSGLETARQMRRFHPRMRIILFTGDSQFGGVQDAAVDATVLKASGLDELKSTVARLVPCASVSVGPES
jgi:carbon storage regulator CsrA